MGPSVQDKEYYDREIAFNKKNPNFNDGHQIEITDECVGCGTCTKVCPIGNCYLKDGHSYRKSETCVFCLACAQNCPYTAIIMNIQDKNPKTRYRNENVSLDDI